MIVAITSLVIVACLCFCFVSFRRFLMPSIAIDQDRCIFSFGAYYKRESRRSDESNKDNKKQPKMKLHQAKASSKYELRVSNEKN
jgi:hypothetical protein